MKRDNHYDTIPAEEERVAEAHAIYSPLSYNQAQQNISS